MSPPVAIADEPAVVSSQDSHAHIKHAACLPNEIRSHNLSQEEYVIPDTPLGQRRALRVVCVGAGYSGIMTAIMVHEKMRDANIDFRIYERHADIGGTWLVSRYP